MPSFTIKGIPAELLALLRERAAANGRSLNQEILFCLRRELSQPKRTRTDADAILKALDRLKP